MNTKILFSAIILIVCQVAWSQGATLTTVTKYDDFVQVLRRLTRPSEKLRLLEAVWGEARAEYNGDLGKVTLLYKQFREIFSTSNSTEAQAAYELQQEVRRYLIEKNAYLLSNAWNGDEFPNTVKMQEFCRALIRDYELKMVKDIYSQAIEESYPHREPELLAAFLMLTYNAGDLMTFEVLLDSQLHLFWNFINTDNVNDNYLFNVAYYLYKLQQDGLYKNVNHNSQRRVEKAILALPTSLQALFFAGNDGFCLLNRDYEEYLYNKEGVNIDTDRRYIFTYRVKNTISSTTSTLVRDIIDTPSPANSTVNIKFALKSKKAQMYLFLEQNLKAYLDMVAAWRTVNVKPDKVNWSVKLVDNHLVFNQNGFLMCVDERYYDSYGRYVYGFNDYRHTELSGECQWIASKC